MIWNFAPTKVADSNSIIIMMMMMIMSLYSNMCFYLCDYTDKGQLCGAKRTSRWQVCEVAGGKLQLKERCAMDKTWLSI